MSSRNTNFLDPLGFFTDIGQGERQNERQSAGTETVSSQILPVFVIAFFASLVNSLFFMNAATATSEGKLLYWNLECVFVIRPYNVVAHGYVKKYED